MNKVFKDIRIGTAVGVILVVVGLYLVTYAELRRPNSELYKNFENKVTTEVLEKDVSCTGTKLSNGLWGISDDWSEYFWSAEVDKEVPAEFTAKRTVWVSYSEDKSIYKYYECFESKYYNEYTLPKGITDKTQTQEILSVTKKECLDCLASQYKEKCKSSRRLAVYWVFILGVVAEMMTWGVEMILEDKCPSSNKSKIKVKPKRRNLK